MTKNFPYKKILPIICLAVVAWVGTGHTVVAAVTGVPSAAASAFVTLFGMDIYNFVVSIISNILQIILTITAWFVGLTGMLLNVSLWLTTHVGEFVDDNGVIFTVWGIIRDLSSMLLIFIILWAAIQMILGMKQPNFSSLIMSIIIMGILINFSFFFTRVAIDASNIVSLEFYNAIAPGKEYVGGSGEGVAKWTMSAFKDGGLSDIFMGALKINEWYKPNKQLGDTSGTGGATGVATANAEIVAAPVRIILITVGGVVVMIMTSLSFLVASFACITRLVILIFLLAFSPIWVASWAAIPGLKDFAKKWTDQFKAQLFFMPVYLMLMYVAIRILTESNLKNLTTAIPQGNLTAYMALFVGFAIIIFMLNLPLAVAVQIAGSSTGWTEKIYNTMKSSIKGFAGRNTLGRAAYALNKSETMSGIAKWSPTAGIITSRGLSKVGSMAFSGKKGGYEGGLKKEKADIEGMHKQIGESVKRSNYAIGEAGDKEYNDAKRAAQATFRSNLASPLSFLPQTNVLNRLIAGRGRLESVTKLDKEADKQYDKDEAKKARSAMNDVNKAIIALRDEEDSEATDTELKSLLTKIGESEKVNAARKALGLEGITQSAEQRVAEIKGNQQKRKKEIKDLQKIAQELGEKIRKGDDAEKEEKDQTLTKKLDEILKREGSGESSKPKKEEKPA